MHIYAFGSICRGEISEESDVDLLAIVEDKDANFNLNQYSVYTYARLEEIWKSGNPFAWHLFLEAKLIFSSNKKDYLADLGSPKKYDNYTVDYFKFSKLLNDSIQKIENNSSSYVFELSNIFLAIRNLAICYSLYFLEYPTFSRHSALSIDKKSITLPESDYKTLERARILCTRGIGENINILELNQVKKQFQYMVTWSKSLNKKGEFHARVS